MHMYGKCVCLWCVCVSVCVHVCDLQGYFGAKARSTCFSVPNAN